MSNDSQLFESREELEKRGLTRDGALFVSDDDLTFLPLMEGKLLHQFDPRFASFERTPLDVRFGRKPSTWNPDDATKRSSAYDVEPRYWVAAPEALQNLRRRGLDDSWALTFRDTTNVISNYRTVVAAIVGGWCYGNKAPNLVSERQTEEERAIESALACAVFNSIPFDYVVRQKFFGANLTKTIIDQAAVPPYEVVAEHSDYVLDRVRVLNYNHDALTGFGRLIGGDDDPVPWDASRRFQAARELDALFLRLYGFTADDTRTALENFPILKEREESQFGEYRTLKTVLELL